MNRLFVVRHGNTFGRGEPPRRIGARTDLPLTTEGEEQAGRLGEMFRNAGVEFSRAMTGPLQRTLDTARLILAAMGDPKPPLVEALLAEIDYGPDENVLEDEVVARHGSETLAGWENHALAPAGWLIDQPARMSWWRNLLATAPSGDTLIVTSNGAARFALLALGSEVLPAVMKLRTGAFGVLEQKQNCGWNVLYWDQRPGECLALFDSR